MGRVYPSTVVDFIIQHKRTKCVRTMPTATIAHITQTPVHTIKDAPLVVVTLQAHPLAGQLPLSSLSLLLPVCSEWFGEGTDTVYMNIWAKVNGQFVDQQQIFFGDHDASSDPIYVNPSQNSVTFVLDDATDTAQYGFNIMNRGGTNLPDFSADLTEIADVASAVAEIAGIFGFEEVATFSEVVAQVAEELADIIDDLFPNCDGMTAAESFQSTKADLDASNPSSNQPHVVQNRGYPGTQANGGCGDPSYYLATFSIQAFG